MVIPVDGFPGARILSLKHNNHFPFTFQVIVCFRSLIPVRRAGARAKLKNLQMKGAAMDYCIACTIKQGRNISFARAPGRFECACGQRLQDHKPTGIELARYKHKHSISKLDSGKMMCNKCKTVFPDDFMECPQCWSKKNPNQDLFPIMKSKQPKGEQL